jgi:hypothetical protein
MDVVGAQIPFFQSVQRLKQALMDQYTQNGHIRSNEGKILNVTDPTIHRLFNYWVQSLETEKNVSQLHDLLVVMSAHCPILYTYDSFVYDIPKTELNELLETLNDTLRYPFDIQVGKNLKEMVSI